MRVWIVLSLFMMSCQTKNTSTLPILNYNFNKNGEKIFYDIEYNQFSDQYGNDFSQKSLKGNITLVNFFFTRCPSICPPMQIRLSQIKQQFDNKDLIIVSHTIDPKNDTTDILLEYSDNFTNENNNWYFVRSSDENLESVGDLYKTNFEADDSGTDFFHSSIVTLLDKDLNIRGFYDILVDSDLSLLEKDIQLLLD